MNPGNFESKIHNEAYRQEFYDKNIDASTWICNHGGETESLNGLWHYAVDQYDTCIRARWFEESEFDAAGNRIPLDHDFEGWPVIPVPCSWNTVSPELYLYEGPLVYTRTFHYKFEKNERVFLKFHGTQYEAFIFLNKKYIGCHKGGSTGFCVEITNHLQEVNRIIVVADNTRRSNQLPAPNPDWFNYGGIYRDVEIMRLPDTYIQAAALRLVPDGKFQNIEVRIELSDVAYSGTAEIEVPELGITQNLRINAGAGSLQFKAAQAPELWTPSNPKLYKCIFRCGADRVEEQIGFREIKTEGTRIYLNGKELFLRGISCHEDAVPGGKYVSPTEVEQEMLIAKELGCNFMRLAHYPHAEYAARIADRIGLLLWEEIPVYWAIDFPNPDTFKDGQNQLQELIRRDINRASVIIWSVGNENADTDERLSFMSRLAEAARKEDPSRLISAACLVNYAENRINDRLAEHLDIIGLNEYFGWYDPDFSKLPDLLSNSRPIKPVVISETGAGARAGHRGGINEHFTEDMQRYVYEQQIKAIKQTDYVRGMSPWILFDFRCPRRTNHLQNGYNRKGLLAEDRQYRKPAFFTLQGFYKQKSDEESDE